MNNSNTCTIWHNYEKEKRNQVLFDWNEEKYKRVELNEFKTQRKKIEPQKLKLVCSFCMFIILFFFKFVLHLKLYAWHKLFS